jgi:4-amino-4-deoxy-L-arabinose transferase-like glycosyltransferase
MMASARHRDWAVAFLCLVLLLGAGVRLFDLGRQTITHPEIYTPGIVLPPGISEPESRYSIERVVTTSLLDEPHPPGYYLFMLAWTKVFGTSIFALRLPSVLFGIASILLTFWLGSREGGKATGVLAAAMLALNGHHVLWSQSARMYSLACFLGLASSLLLVRLARDRGRWWGGLVLYALITFFGLATVIFYWPILFLQIAWVVVRSDRPSARPSLFRWQLLIFAQASPLFSVAVFQSSNPSYAKGEGAQFLSRFFQLGFLFEPDDKLSLGPIAIAGTFILDLVTLFLLAVGLGAQRQSEVEERELPEPPNWLFLCAVGLGLAGHIAFTWWTHTLLMRRMMAAGLLPLAIALVDFFILSRRYWPQIQAPILRARRLLPAGLFSLSGLLAIVPIALMLIVSLAVPLFVSRGVLLFTPYLLITVSLGLVTLVRRNRGCLVLGAVLAVALPLSIYHFYYRPTSPRDYKALAERLKPEVRDSDLIFLIGHESAEPARQSAWQTTPIFYYLDANRFHFVDKDFANALGSHPQSRVWVITWETNEMLPEMKEALRGYSPGERIEVWGARAALYSKKVDTN